MKNLLTIIFSFISLSTFSQNFDYRRQYHQEVKERGIVEIVDELTQQWDEGAPPLETYRGFKKFCRTRDYRQTTIDLLNKIHHYDTVLYFTVTKKYNDQKDAEAKETLDDISIVEEKYTTRAFMDFLHKECRDVNDVARNFSQEEGAEFEKEKELIEAELVKYVEAITTRIDNVDEHIHHLEKLYEK